MKRVNRFWKGLRHLRKPGNFLGKMSVRFLDAAPLKMQQKYYSFLQKKQKLSDSALFV